MKIPRPEAANGKKIVVIVGCGFAGLNAAKKLAKSEDVLVFIIDRQNHHLFQPLLYQVATAGLNVADIAIPIRSQFSSSSNVLVHLGKVQSVSLDDKTVRIQEVDGDRYADFGFDYLILACGAQHSYFGHPEWEEYAPGLKTLEQAIEIRKRTLLAFEKAENEFDPQAQKALLNFVVVGGGPTGVELAGAIADVSRTVLVNDFKRIDPSSAQVILVEAGPRLLTPFDESLSERTKRDLISLGVNVMVNSRVEDINSKGVVVNGQLIESQTVIWAAGVQATQIEMAPPPVADRAGRIKVDKNLAVPGFPDVFVIGDMAAVEMGGGKLVPGLAPAAIQEGKYVAQQILAKIEGKDVAPFKYWDKGQLATIGKNKAVMQAGSFKASGYFAWLTWLFIHVFYLVGFKNRVAVMSTWAWSYLWSKRGARLITQNNWRLRPDLKR